MTDLPELSVVMSVYNGQDYLEESIDSVLNQSYSKFEFIIINDGSTDNTEKIINRYAGKDDRIVPVHQQNAGLAKSLNRGIEKAKGKYIARQDADDVSLPNRFEIQMAFLQSHPEIVLCGTWFLEQNEGKGKKIRKYPVEDGALRKNIKYVNNFCHPSVIYLKAAFIMAGYYDERLSTGQDFELWMRLCNYGEMSNIPQILVKKRIGTGNTISWQKRNEKIKLWEMIYKKHFKHWHQVNVILFLRFYMPLLCYQYIPVPLIKIIRLLRYR